MNLTNVTFNYEIPKRKFSNIWYTFNPISENTNPKEIVELAKSSLQELELLITSMYDNKFQKEEVGEIDSYSVTHGYKYKNKSNAFSLINYVNSTQLKYQIKLNSLGNPADLEIHISNSNPKNMLKLHDNILIIPDLKIEPDAIKQLENIEYLRHQKFDASKYLHLK